MFASGKHALGICDRCGRQYKLMELVPEFFLGTSKHNRVCADCWDSDHPQNYTYRMDHVDYEALRDPRSDLPERDSSRELTNQIDISTLTAHLK